MQILLHSDPHTDGRLLMADHLTAVVNDALGRFGERVTRVEAHLSDASSSAESGDDHVYCTLEARLSGLDAVVVKDHASSVHQALNGAVRKLKRAVGTEIAKHDPRGRKAPPSAASLDGPDEAPIADSLPVPSVATTSAAESSNPSLPHDRDEKVGTTGGVPSERVQQGARDLKRGLRDTTRAPEADNAYRKLKD